nr:tyrosinase family protein [uncultured Sphingomonas sp.]
MPQANDAPIANPTYLGNIAGFFDPGEIQCMSAQGIDLGSYEGVRRHATDIYEQTKAGNMPLGGTPWTTVRVQTFLNWINTGFPMGEPPTPSPDAGTSPAGDDPLVENPTYMGDIRFFFRSTDIACMKPYGINLGTYAGVRASASAIYQATKTGAMPMGGPAWTANRVQTFLNWMNANYPMGSARAPQAHATAALRVAAASPDVRLRKNLASLSPAEIDQLKLAFGAIMALEPEDPKSYFGVAALHGLPNAYCMHHVDGYNPWHRVYVNCFEDALRAVPGCADITLPYWDITEPVPPVLYEPPFASYTLPVGLNGDYQKGYITQRSDAATIEAALRVAPSVKSRITAALASSRWGAFQAGQFQGNIIAAHDDGHDSCGATMSDQSVAAYDPIFWFFHCNWERMWQSWQVLASADTVPGFISTLDGDTDWLGLALDPFPIDGEQTIVWPNVTYEKLAGGGALMAQDVAGHAAGERAFRIAAPSLVSLRVKDIDRMNIEGTFTVWLLADGKPIARRAFFQPRAPRECTTCRKQALVSLDFPLEQDLIAGRSLSIEIKARAPAGGPEVTVPLAQAGNPTINVRLLLSED